MRFGRPERERTRKSGVRSAECAGPGEGYREGSDKGFGQGSGKEGKDLASSRRICCPGSSTPSPGGAADRFAHSAEPFYLGCLFGELFGLFVW